MASGTPRSRSGRRAMTTGSTSAPRSVRRIVSASSTAAPRPSGPRPSGAGPLTTHTRQTSALSAVSAVSAVQTAAIPYGTVVPTLATLAAVLTLVGSVSGVLTAG